MCQNCWNWWWIVQYRIKRSDNSRRKSHNQKWVLIYKNSRLDLNCKSKDENSPLTKTWKMKNRVINDSSNPVYWGIPSKRAKRRRKIGSNIISTANNTGGKMPYTKKTSKNHPLQIFKKNRHTEMIPTTGGGSLHIHARKDADLQTV